MKIPNLKNGRGRNDYNNGKPGNKTQFPAKWVLKIIIGDYTDREMAYVFPRKGCRKNSCLTTPNVSHERGVESQ
jgi:hypothetical protein